MRTRDTEEAAVAVAEGVAWLDEHLASLEDEVPVEVPAGAIRTLVERARVERARAEGRAPRGKQRP